MTHFVLSKNRAHGAAGVPRGGMSPAMLSWSDILGSVNPDVMPWVRRRSLLKPRSGDGALAHGASRGDDPNNDQEPRRGGQKNPTFFRPSGAPSGAGILPTARAVGYPSFGPPGLPKIGRPRHISHETVLKRGPGLGRTAPFRHRGSWFPSASEIQRFLRPIPPPHARLGTCAALALLLAIVAPPARAADPVFSGPQPSEKTTPFKVLDIGPDKDGVERDPVTEAAEGPIALVFIHGIERSLVPLLRVVDQYGAARKDRIRTEFVFLAADRLEGEQRAKAASRSLRLQSRVGLSVDGPEGPGNYGLNKDCLMTIVAAKGNVVTANFALVQPGIADAPKVIEALARTCGDTNPPPIADLSEPAMGRDGARRGDPAMRRSNADMPTAKEPFPGAVPTDARLQSLLRGFIRSTNDVATTDRILADVKNHIQGKADLEKQAADGWTRVLHFGDRYGNEYSRKVGREFLEQLQTPVK